MKIVYVSQLPDDLIEVVRNRLTHAGINGEYLTDAMNSKISDLSEIICIKGLTQSHPS